MAAGQAKNFIERLPEIVDREEKDISHLDPKMVEILYPRRASKDCTITIVFSPIDSGEMEGDKACHDRAVALAEKAPHYQCKGDGFETRHYATYSVEQVNALHELFELVGGAESSEVLVQGKKIPYARELWLPLFWLFIKGERS